MILTRNAVISINTSECRYNGSSVQQLSYATFKFDKEDALIQGDLTLTIEYFRLLSD